MLITALASKRKMVKTFRAYLPPDAYRKYSCVHCRAHLASHDDLISKVNSSSKQFLKLNYLNIFDAHSKNFHNYFLVLVISRQSGKSVPLQLSVSNFVFYVMGLKENSTMLLSRSLIVLEFLSTAVICQKF